MEKAHQQVVKLVSDMMRARSSEATVEHMLHAGQLVSERRLV